jgi:hypothetical protein
MRNKHSIERGKIQRDWTLRAIESVLRLRGTGRRWRLLVLLRLSSLSRELLLPKRREQGVGAYIRFVILEKNVCEPAPHL